MVEENIELSIVQRLDGIENYLRVLENRLAAIDDFLLHHKHEEAGRSYMLPKL